MYKYKGKKRKSSNSPYKIQQPIIIHALQLWLTHDATTRWKRREDWRRQEVRLLVTKQQHKISVTAFKIWNQYTLRTYQQYMITGSEKLKPNSGYKLKRQTERRIAREIDRKSEVNNIQRILMSKVLLAHTDSNDEYFMQLHETLITSIKTLPKCSPLKIQWIPRRKQGIVFCTICDIVRIPGISMLNRTMEPVDNSKWKIIVLNKGSKFKKKMFHKLKLKREKKRRRRTRRKKEFSNRYAYFGRTN